MLQSLTLRCPQEVHMPNQGGESNACLRMSSSFFPRAETPRRERPPATLSSG